MNVGQMLLLHGETLLNIVCCNESPFFLKLKRKVEWEKYQVFFKETSTCPRFFLENEPILGHLLYAVIGRLFSNGNIMNMTFSHASAGYPNELSFFMKNANSLATCVAHTGANTAQ